MDPVDSQRYRGLSISDGVRALAREFRSAGVETPDLDARLLVAAATGVTREEILTDPSRVIDEPARIKLGEYRQRRLAKEPVSRILGQRGFYGRWFQVTPATLDPRADSETLVDAVLELVATEEWQSKPLRILDVGTGSGCLLVTLLAELPSASGVGTDICEAALATACVNARTHGVTGRVAFEMRRGLDGVVGPFDILVSNPPYIASSDIAGLDDCVRNYDPLSALDGGPDGLDIYREIFPGLLGVVPTGWSLFEVGSTQAKAVAELACAAIPAHRLTSSRSWKDFGGHTRSVAVRTQL